MITSDKMKEYRRAYKLRHPERVKASKEAYRKRNLDKWAAYTLKWRTDNPLRAKEVERTYCASEKGRNSIALKNIRKKVALYHCRKEPYRRLDIFIRDHGVCCICFKEVDLSFPPRHPKSFTVQHHIPLSLGGADAPDNLGVAHYSCNSKIGNRRATHHV